MNSKGNEADLSVGLLVTNYNSWELALACVEAHLRLEGATLERVILLDDCSGCPPPRLPNSRCEIVRNDTNLGFAASLNKGIRLLRTEIAVVFDADSLPLTRYAEQIVDHFDREPRLGILGFQLLDNRRHPAATTIATPSIWSLILGQKIDSWRIRWFGANGKYCTTAAIAIRAEAFEDVGGFDPLMGWLDVDVDFGINLDRHGWLTRTDSKILVQHVGGGTPMQTSDRVIRFYRSRWRLLRKYGRVPLPTIARYMIVARLAAEWVFLSVCGKQLFGSETIHLDKLRGRRVLLKEFWEGCR